MRFSGPLHRRVLEQSLREIVRRHEILRTTFALHAGEPCQVIHSLETYQLSRIDLGALTKEDREKEVQRLARQEAQIPFDLICGPLLRTMLVQLDANEHVLLMAMHHIVSDGWSNTVFVRELNTLYTAFVPVIPRLYRNWQFNMPILLPGNANNCKERFWRSNLRTGGSNWGALFLLICRATGPVRASKAIVAVAMCLCCQQIYLRSYLR